MSGFVILAAVMVVVVMGAVLWPLLRPRAEGSTSWLTAAVMAAVLVGGSAALYPAWSKWDWSAPAPAADSPAAMVGQLARRLEKQPDDLEGWLMLGRSYAVIEQFPLSVRAYQRANQISAGRSVEALSGLAEALILADRGGLEGQAGKLFEQALAIDPKSTKALFYSAIAALERGEGQLARERVAMLLAGNPPPEVRNIIERIDEQARALEVTKQMAAATPAATPGASQSTGAPKDSVAPATVSLRITLSPEVASKANAGAPLFVLARIPGQRGPPLAAKRLVARFPQEVVLSSADAMIAGTGFVAGQEIEVMARIANGGSAISRSGDPFGKVVVKAGQSQRVSIEINQLTP
jgi:cytochrome c-type biogenesis protein CcmH